MPAQVSGSALKQMCHASSADGSVQLSTIGSCKYADSQTSRRFRPDTYQPESL